MKKKILLLASLCITGLINLRCQPENNYSLSNGLAQYKNSELLKNTLKRKISSRGIYNGKHVLFIKDSTNNRKAYLFDEYELNITPFLQIRDDIKSKIIDILVSNNIILKIGFYQVEEQYLDSPIEEIPIEQHEYQDFWIQFNDKNIKIDSFPYHYIDKYIRCNFSDDGKKLICNPYTSVTPGYSPETDNRIYLYDLHELEKGNIVKRVIPCERCLNNFIVDNYYYFNKEIPIGHGYDGFYNNIYKAPLSNISDTIKIAHDIELINITPDGKFILGEKYLYGKFALVIINVETKRYQYILGRDYPIDNCYYSVKEKKFAFDFGKCIVYIEFPDKYPFDALENTFFKKTTNTKNDEKNFWIKYTHKPFLR